MKETKRVYLNSTFIPAQPGWMVFFQDGNEDEGSPVIAWAVQGHRDDDIFFAFTISCLTFRRSKVQFLSNFLVAR
jgi:hypothetical protein